MKTALYTTLYPDALRFWDDFMGSVVGQSDQDFDLHVALDMVSADDPIIESSLRRRPQSTSENEFNGEMDSGLRQNDGILIPHFYLPSTKTPSSIRQECWQHLIESGYQVIVMVDADDVLMPDRVKNAKAGLAQADMDVCGLQLVDVNLQQMDWTLQPDPTENTKDYILQANDIGLSNTAYRAEFLQRLIPALDNIIMLDWFLALRSVEEGARIHKRPDLDMLYRQYEGNVAHFIPPYTEDMIKTQTQRVIDFWQSVIPHLNHLQTPAKKRLEVVKNTPITIPTNDIQNPKWWGMVG